MVCLSVKFPSKFPIEGFNCWRGKRCQWYEWELSWTIHSSMFGVRSLHSRNSWGKWPNHRPIYLWSWISLGDFCSGYICGYSLIQRGGYPEFSANRDMICKCTVCPRIIAGVCNHLNPTCCWFNHNPKKYWWQTSNISVQVHPHHPHVFWVGWTDGFLKVNH